MWAEMRGQAISDFPPAAIGSVDGEAYMKTVEDGYVVDAFHSLSFEGYQVSEVLIERVKSERWIPDCDAGNRGLGDALAARGYWQAFLSVQAV